jgi:hypothetical protein
LAVACPDDVAIINARCIVRTSLRQRLVLVSGLPVFGFAADDLLSEAYAMLMLVQSGFATQKEVAGGFGVTTRTVRRNQDRFEAGGIAMLGGKGGWPKGKSRLPEGIEARAAQLATKGTTVSGMARVLGVSTKSVRKVLLGLGLLDSSPEVPRELYEETKKAASAAAAPADDSDAERDVLSEATAEISSQGAPAQTQEGRSCPSGAAEEEPGQGAEAPDTAGEHTAAPAGLEAAPMAAGRARGEGGRWEAVEAGAGDAAFTLDQDPSDRSMDRMLARLGLLEDAAPLFASGRGVQGAGVLLAVPVLVASGVFEEARRVYGSLGPAFYGLRTTLLTLLLMALLRIKRPEGLKERRPRDLGRALGLDRAPEVKTVRRKLGLLAGRGAAGQFAQAMARRRIEQRGEVLGFLYVDGHVRVYHGDKQVPKAHVARMRLALPATTDYWANDAAGDPLLVVTAEANAGLVKMLPLVLAQARPLLGERRLTVVFDRGGYSTSLFRQLHAEHVDILTYRKGASRKVPVRLFGTHEGVVDGRAFAFSLADQNVRIGRSKKGCLTLRQVTRRSPDGHQTPILTTRSDLTALEVAVRMFDRWRQENFFKYMRDEYALDTLVSYAAEQADPERDVPNPARQRIDETLKKAREELRVLRAEYGSRALSNVESRRPTMRGFKIANGELGQRLRAAVARVARLEKRRAQLPLRVPVRQARPRPEVKLSPEIGMLQNVLKMLAYQAESDLLRLLTPHYRRTFDEGRTFLQSALASSGDIDVTADTLTVTLAPQSSPHRTTSVAALCDVLNTTPAYFPGTRLRLHLAVAPHS